jgi:hypothetical protein
MATAASIPMIEITIINSINVNPDRFPASLIPILLCFCIWLWEISPVRAM